MWMPRSQTEKREAGNGLVAVAIDRDKGSQNALKWAIDHLLQRGQTVILIHVNLKMQQSFSNSSSVPSPSKHLISLSNQHADPSQNKTKGWKSSQCLIYC